LLAADHLGELIVDRVRGGMPVLATCAGVIVLACSVTPSQPSLGVLDVDVVRNAYGRQVASKVVAVDVDPQLGPPTTMEGVFIRAPRVIRVGPRVEVLGRRHDHPVLFRYGRIVAATFHPELTDDDRVHRMFLRIAEGDDG
jgi:5'-phosphate synthase pdxT subunit